LGKGFGYLFAEVSVYVFEDSKTLIDELLGVIVFFDLE